MKIKQTSICEYGEIGRRKGLKIRQHPLFLIKTNYN